MAEIMRELVEEAEAELQCLRARLTAGDPETSLA
jgi:hypothetical protein